MILVRYLNLRHLRFKWGRALLSLMGIVVGVSTFIFAPSLADTIRRASLNAVDDIGGRATLELRGEISPDVLEDVRAIAPLSVPLVNGGGLVVGQSELVMYLGIDPSLDQQVRTYTVTRGEFLKGEGQLLLSESYALENKFELGQSLTLIGLGGVRPLTLVGTLTGGVGRLNSGDIAVMNLSDALALRGGQQYDAVSVVAGESQNIATLRTELQSVVPETIEVDAPSERNKSAEQFQAVVSSMITVISFMILGMGSLLVYNTMAVSVAERRTEIGILRSLGVTRAEIHRMYLLESMLLGFLGSILGILLGYVLIEYGKNAPVIPASSNLVSTAEIAVPSWLPFVALFFGMVVPVLAGLLPSRTAANVDPTEALSSTHAENGTLQLSRRRLVIGLALTGIALLLGVITPKSMEGVMVSNSALFALMIGIAFLFPPLLIASGDIATRLMGRLFGTPGLLAAGSLTRRPRRLTAMGMVLMFGAFLAVITSGSNTGYSSFIEEWQSAENGWTLSAVGAGRDPLTPSLNIPSQVIETISAHSLVNGIAKEYYTSLRYGTTDYTLRAVDMNAYLENGGRLLWNEGDETTGYERLQDADRPAVLIAGFASAADGLKVGSTVTLDTPGGQVNFDIIGRLFGVVEGGMMVIDLDTYKRYWQSDAVNRVSIRLHPDADVQAVRREFQRQFAVQGVLVFDNQATLAAFTSRLQSITTVSQLLTSLLALILVAGLSSTLFVAVIDRRREIGMLRAVGMLRHQITQSIVLEAVLLLALASVLGIPGGFLGNILNTTLLEAMLGLKSTINVGDAALMIFLMLVTVIISAYLPARTAGRTDVLEAMRYE